MRLSHVVLNSPKPERMLAFYETHLGFRLSDTLNHPEMGDIFYFMRCSPQHHSMAIARGPHTSLQHVSFELRGIDEYMFGTGRLIRAGLEEAMGSRQSPRRGQHLLLLPRPERQHDGVHHRTGGHRRGPLAPAHLQYRRAGNLGPVGHVEPDERVHHGP